MAQSTDLGDGRREDNNFVQLAHPLHELIDARSLDNVNVVEITLNLYGNRKIGLMKNLIR